jgi:cytoskeletal protein RodZ
MHVMKRCPECDFLYFDSDQFCDLDGTPLKKVDTSNTTNSEMEAPSIRQGWKTFSMLIVPGIVFGVILLVVYNWVVSQRRNLVVTNEVTNVTTNQPSPGLAPSPVESASPKHQPSKAPLAKASPAKIESPAPARLSSKPISTQSESKEKRSMIIRLRDGGTIAADEAWRTKDGIWYRRNGVVTLLKRQQVKAIERAP